MEDAQPPVEASVEDETDGAVDALPETIRTSLYRIVQEAVNNAVKHARASRIDVRISHAGPRIAIAVEDDGIGIDVGKTASTNGIGHMQTRAALISADLDIGRGETASGTRVRIEVSRDVYDTAGAVVSRLAAPSSEAAE